MVFQKEQERRQVMKNNEPRICTIIVSYNFEEWIDKCLGSLRESSLPTKIIVIDNNSSDDTCNRIKKDYPEVTLIENHENWGFGKANNLGLRYAKDQFDYLFLLNQDAWIEPDTLQKLADASASNPDYGIISPIHLNGKGDKLDFGFSTYSGLRQKEETLAIDKDIVECKFINAAFWLLPVSTVKTVGGFATIFSHYGEDVNYAQRVKYQKLKIGFVPGALAYHDREFRKVDRQKYFYSEYVYLLTEAANIHYPVWKAFGYSCLAAMKKSLISLFQGRVNDFGSYLQIAFQIVGQAREIQLTRKTTKGKTGAYLRQHEV